MWNIERYKDILEDLFIKDYLYRSSYDEWYRLKEYQKEIEEYIQNTFGYTLCVSNDVISLNKYSVIGDKTKGIKGFSNLDEYIILPLVLNYLEDKYDMETLLISEIAEHVVNNFPEKRDWENRRVSSKLVRVLKYCQEKNFIYKLDGSEDGYEKDCEEVLYENTGISKHFMETLPYDLEGFDINSAREYNIKNLEKVQILRRGLLENFLITKEYPYFSSLLEFRDEVEDLFEELFGMKLIIFDELAYLLRSDESIKVSQNFPSPKNNLERIGLKFFKYLDRDNYQIEEVLNEFIEYKEIYKPTFTKGNLNKKEETLLNEILELGMELKIIEVDETYLKLSKYIEHFTIDILEEGDENE
ncbi:MULTISPECIES: DUF2398 family protein [Psychrilyobacter]|uniref:DUF2398 family protein n=1 Tax=Psychrilyobacter piezotolerans TaxID=2293438 RepID=A0ABX9KI79_9FUSO|nr:MULTISPECIES: DUF2398 family protein [Psychrilyobacter]MCS5420944.1 TIGR02678 family protein [Psychrilyobacter sp. S5]NDI77649.1 DUF2398 family protein [Psychrilyobacter piezotolerans]RDE62657.1 DUF2398 family protein [Psychrilyobacter sp. S5]REI41587.1 DUF2398 family protein [Psychrilyobacter piezotolerans]